MSLLTALLPLLIGWLLVASVWPRDALARTLPLRLVLAVGFGVGVASLSAFTLLLLRDEVAPLAVLLLEGAVAAGLGWNLRRRSGPTASRLAPTPAGERFSPLQGAGVAVAALGACLAFTLATCAEPNGVTDALSIWNLRARMLAESGVHWRQAFAAELPHADYPLLVPLAAVRGWCGLVDSPAFVTGVVAAFFTIGTSALLWAGVTAAGGNGLVAAAALLGFPAMTRIGASQLADVPLAFFALAAVTLLTLHSKRAPAGRSLLHLAGLSLGLAVWTKNEGVPMLVVIPAAWMLSVAMQARRDQSWRERTRDLLALSIGALPALLAVATFKAWLAPSNDLVAEVAGAGIGERILDGERWAAIATAVVRMSWYSGQVMLPCVVLYWLLAGRRITFPLAAAGVMLLAFCGVYLVASANLEWHLGTSMPRLLLQLLPMALFGVFLPASPRPAQR
jgi:hypothetical protein